MKVNEAIARFLTDNSVSTIFGVMGDANMFNVDRFVRTGRGKYVAAAHEAGATLVAIGYVSVSGQVDVASVTQGPALANALPALLKASTEGEVRPLTAVGSNSQVPRQMGLSNRTVFGFLCSSIQRT